MSYHLSKEQIFSSQIFTVGTSRKRPAPVSDHVHFLGLTVFFNFLLFLTSCEQPLDLKSDVQVRCMYHASQITRRAFSDNMELRIS